jgi:hypothetical protein
MDREYNYKLLTETPLLFIEKYSLYKMNDVIKLTSMCGTVIKRELRKAGIERWPYRPFISIQKLIDNGTEKEKQIGIDARKKLLENPNIPLKTLIKKSIVNNVNTKILTNSLQKRDCNTIPTSNNIGLYKTFCFKTNPKIKNKTKDKVHSFKKSQNKLDKVLIKLNALGQHQHQHQYQQIEPNKFNKFVVPQTSTPVVIFDKENVDFQQMADKEEEDKCALILLQLVRPKQETECALILSSKLVEIPVVSI